MEKHEMHWIQADYLDCYAAPGDQICEASRGVQITMLNLMWQLFRRIPRAKTRFLWDPAVNYNAQPTIIIEDFWGFREEIHFFVDWHTLCTILNAMVRVEQALDKEEEAKCKA